MPAGVETPLMGLALWLAFNATVYYCLNSATFAPGIGANSSKEPTGRVQAALLAIYLVALIALMIALCPAWSYKPAPFEVFFYPLFYIGVLVHKMLDGARVTSWKGVNWCIGVMFPVTALSMVSLFEWLFLGVLIPLALSICALFILLKKSSD